MAVLDYLSETLGNRNGGKQIGNGLILCPPRLHGDSGSMRCAFLFIPYRCQSIGISAIICF